MDWFLYDNGLRHKGVKKTFAQCRILKTGAKTAPFQLFGKELHLKEVSTPGLKKIY